MIRTICDLCGRELRPDEKAEVLEVNHFPQGWSSKLDVCPDCMVAFEDLLIQFKENRREAWRDYQTRSLKVRT